MLGHPDAPVAPLLGVHRHVPGVVERAARVGLLGDTNEVEDGQWYHALVLARLWMTSVRRTAGSTTYGLPRNGPAAPECRRRIRARTFNGAVPEPHECAKRDRKSTRLNSSH